MAAVRKDDLRDGILLPNGSTVITGGELEITIIDGAGIHAENGLTMVESGVVQVAGWVVTLTEGGTIWANEEGYVMIPGGFAVNADGMTVTIPACGGVLDPVTGDVTKNDTGSTDRDAKSGNCTGKDRQ